MFLRIKMFRFHRPIRPHQIVKAKDPTFPQPQAAKFLTKRKSEFLTAQIFTSKFTERRARNKKYETTHKNICIQIILTHIFLSIYKSVVPRVTLRRAQKPSKSRPPPRPRRIRARGPKEPGEAGGKTSSPDILLMSDNLSTTRPQTKGRKVTNIQVLLDRRYHKVCTPIPVIVMYLYDSILPTAANGPHKRRAAHLHRGAAVDTLISDFSPSVSKGAPDLWPVPLCKAYPPSSLESRAPLILKRCVSKVVGRTGPASTGPGPPRRRRCSITAAHLVLCCAPNVYT